MKNLDFQHELWDFAKFLSGKVETIFRPTIESFGLTMLQARILVELRENNTSTVGNLGNIIGASSGNASTICKKLEQAGFITRNRNLNDERVVNLKLTASGATTLQQIEQAIQKKYEPVLNQKTSTDFEIILAGINKIKEILNEVNETNQA